LGYRCADLDHADMEKQNFWSLLKEGGGKLLERSALEKALNYC